MTESISPEIRTQVAGDIRKKLEHRLSVLNTTIDQTYANYTALCGRRLEIQETLIHLNRLAQEDETPPAEPPAPVEEPPKVEVNEEGCEEHPNVEDGVEHQ